MRKSDEFLAIYLKEIGEVPLLDGEEEKRLALQIEDGRAAETEKKITDKSAVSYYDIQKLDKRIRKGKLAKKKFFQANLRLVVSLAKKYPLPASMDILDLIQEGNIGLNHAIDMYEVDRGYKFSTYATFWIRQHIGRALDVKANSIKIAGDKAFQLRHTLKKVGGDFSALPEDLQKLYALNNVTSLNKTVGDEGSSSLEEMVADETVNIAETIADEEERTTLFREVLGLLSEEEMRILCDHYGIFSGVKVSYTEIARRDGRQPEKIREIAKAARQKLIANLPANKIPESLRWIHEDYSERMEDVSDLQPSLLVS